MLYPNSAYARDAVKTWMEKGFYKVPADYKIRSLVGLSGGMDSVVLLATLLAYTDHEVHAHHVEIRNAENRADAENQSLQKILAYMQRYYRPFTYSSSKYEMTIAPPDRVGADITLIMFMMSRVNLAVGYFNDIIWTAQYKGVATEYMEAAAVNAACATNYRSKPLWAMPFLGLTKDKLYGGIPPELARLTWSCRYPGYDMEGNAVACNNCHACRAVVYVENKLKEFHAQNASPASAGPKP